MFLSPALNDHLIWPFPGGLPSWRGGRQRRRSADSAVGVTRQTIHSVEKGKFVPSALLAMKISRFFGKTVEEIFFIVEAE